MSGQILAKIPEQLEDKRYHRGQSMSYGCSAKPSEPSRSCGEMTCRYSMVSETRT